MPSFRIFLAHTSCSAFKIFLLSLLLVWGWGAFSLTARAQMQHAAGGSLAVSATLHENASLLASPRLESLLTPTSTVSFDLSGLNQPKLLRRFYRENGYRPLWVEEQGVTRRGMALIEALKHAPSHGLLAADYHLHQISRLLKMPVALNRARLELLLTDAAVQYAADLSGPRKSLSAALQASTPIHDAAISPAAALTALSQSRDPANFYAPLTPEDAVYKAMQKRYMQFRILKDSGMTSPPSVHPGKSVLRLGDEDMSVPVLRERLGLPQSESKAYDRPLYAAVRDFQKRNGLKADGHLGPKTLQVMNDPLGSAMHRIAVNLERTRALKTPDADRFIRVNTARQELFAYESGAEAFRMPVAVGSRWRQTPAFETRITGVRINPTWTLPETILREDYLPRLKGDPGLLLRKNIRVFENWMPSAGQIDPHVVDWDSIGWKRLMTMRFRMQPGPDNPLGRLRILMPNRHHIYLHDTNHPEVFTQAARNVSSGCIRMKEPDKISRFVLEGLPAGDSERLQSLIGVQTTRDIRALQQIPVQIVYRTAWLDEGGRLVLGRDVYGRDQKLMAHMAQYQKQRRESTEGTVLALNRSPALLSFGSGSKAALAGFGL